MTDKEIEKVLSALSEFTCPDLDISIHSLAEDALRYIRDLKAQNEQLRKVNNAMGLAMNCFCNKEEND